MLETSRFVSICREADSPKASNAVMTNRSAWNCDTISGTMDRILVVDDDVEVTKFLGYLLRGEGFEVGVAHEGAQAIEKVLHEPYSLVLLDVSLPTASGFEVLMGIRERSLIPVIMVTGRDDPVDRVLGLRLGADDYLSKPFVDRELIARIRAVLRRRMPLPPEEAPSEKDFIRVGDVALWTGSRKVTRCGVEVSLTTGEFDVLQVLLLEAGNIVSREDLFQRALGRRFSPFDRSVDNHVSSLRQKLGRTPRNELRIRTVRNSGYLYVKTSCSPMDS